MRVEADTWRKAGFKLVVGSAVAIALMVFAVMLWTRNLIVFGAPLGVASVAAAWVTVDNQFVYGRRKTQSTVDDVSPAHADDTPEMHP